MPPGYRSCTVSPGMQQSHGAVTAGGEVPLPSPIKRIFYLAKEGTDREHEVQLPANAAVLSALADVGAVVYGVGSLYTSIAPSLVLQGVGEGIAARSVPKILMLNGSHDRETSACLAHPGPMSAVRPTSFSL